MKLMAIVAGPMLAFALATPVQAVNMHAGPLYPTGSVHCECEIVNISTAAKTVTVKMLDGLGNQLATIGPTSLPAGDVLTLASGVAGRQYCKFIGASPTYFLATLACFRPYPDDSDFVALPAR